MYDWYKAIERVIITKGNLFARLDVFLCKEDGDFGRFVIDGGRVRLARMIHAGDTQGDGYIVSHVESMKGIGKEFTGQRSVQF